MIFVLDVEVPPHPPYSLDLAVENNRLFRSLVYFPGRKRFSNYEELRKKDVFLALK